MLYTTPREGRYISAPLPHGECRGQGAKRPLSPRARGETLQRSEAERPAQDARGLTEQDPDKSPAAAAKPQKGAGVGRGAPKSKKQKRDADGEAPAPPLAQYLF